MLEAAAKAAGFVSYDHENSLATDMWSRGYRWNPFTDDGDALRLGVRCAQLFGFYRFLRAWLIEMSTEQGGVSDSCAATRRAIVKAAVKLSVKAAKCHSDK